jgi:hypothetical protein
MVRVRSISLPQAGHKFFRSRLSPRMLEIMTSQAQTAVAMVTIAGFLVGSASAGLQLKLAGRMIKMEQFDVDAVIEEIKALEDRRYRAMLAGDTAVLDELCSVDLIYTHSKADHDDKQSYLHKVGTRYFTYLEITHPADRILVVEGAALVTRPDDGQGFGGRRDRAR